jgi:hypothetical protein
MSAALASIKHVQGLLENAVLHAVGAYGGPMPWA